MKKQLIILGVVLLGLILFISFRYDAQKRVINEGEEWYFNCGGTHDEYNGRCYCGGPYKTKEKAIEKGKYHQKLWSERTAPDFNDHCICDKK